MHLVASEPNYSRIVTGRVDARGCLVAADQQLASLQIEAGSAIGARFALPQIAAVVRLARQLGVPLSRPVTVAGASHDCDLWVRAKIEGDEVALEIEGWRPRPPAAPRLDLMLDALDNSTLARDPATGEWATNAALRLTALSPDLAEMLKIDPADAMGQPLTRFLKLDEDNDGILPLLVGLAARAAFSGQKATLRTGNGVPLLLSGWAVRDERGKFAGLTGRAFLPISAQSAVNPREPEDDGFTDRINRSLRTPLSRIIAATYNIGERNEGPLRNDYTNYATDIAAAGRHLTWVSSKSNEGSQTSGPVDLIAASSEAVSLVASSGAVKGVAVDIMASSRLVARGDKRNVVQIIVNILSNAVRHSPPGEPVVISIAENGSRALLTIADRGPGIRTDDQRQIFESCEWLENIETEKGHGLTIALNLARRMGGDILIDSAPGEGARITLELPIFNVPRSA